MREAAEKLDLAERLLAGSSYQEAHRLCLSVLETSPRTGRAWFLLGLLAADHGNTAKAAELFQKAVLLDPAAARHHAQFARTLIGLNQRQAAIDSAERAARLAPGDALTLDTIGVVFSRAGLHERALPFYLRAAELEPRNPSFQYNLAAAQQFAGDFAAAEAAYGRAVAEAPTLYRAWSSRIQLARQTEQRNFLPELQRLMDGAPPDDPDAALHLGHSLAKTYEDLGDYAAALSWLDKAKGPKRRALGYRYEQDAALFEAAMASADGSPPPGNGSEEPIFVVGMPRTGTTLVDRILSSHPQVASAGELSNFALLVKRATATPSNLVMDAPTFAAARRLDFAKLGQAYVDSTRPLTGRTPRFIDKMPLNAFYAGLIHRALPNARIICLRRHPLDACLSNYRQLFATNFSYYNYALSLEDVARYYADFDRMVSHWRGALPPERFTEVAYEDLVSDLEGQTRRLLAFCGLSWDPACLAFHQNAAPVATASSVQVRQPLYATSVGRWRKYGSGLDPARRILEAAGCQL